MLWIAYYAACLKAWGNLDLGFFGVDSPSDITASFVDGNSLQHLVTRIRANSQKTFEDWNILKSLLWFSSEHQRTATFFKKSLLDGEYGWNVNTAEVTSAHKIKYWDRPYSYFFNTFDLFCCSPEAWVVMQMIFKVRWTSSAISPAFVRN